MIRRSFTIVEVIIAIALVLLLAGLMIPVGARLATTRERLDTEVRRLEQIAMLFDVLDASFATCAADEVAIQGGTLRWTQRAVRPGVGDRPVALGLAQSMSLRVLDDSLVLGSGVSGLSQESEVVRGVKRAQFRAVASRAGHVEVQLWFADVSAASVEQPAGLVPEDFDEFGMLRDIAEPPSTRDVVDPRAEPEEPEEPDVQRVFRLRVERVAQVGGDE